MYFSSSWVNNVEMNHLPDKHQQQFRCLQTFNSNYDSNKRSLLLSASARRYLDADGDCDYIHGIKWVYVG